MRGFGPSSLTKKEDMKSNPLANSNLFKTPSSMEELTSIADSMSNTSEAWRMMVFTMNFCYAEVEKARAEQE
jgi:hypothetical protein